MKSKDQALLEEAYEKIVQSGSQQFENIWKRLRRDENFVPRSHKTIGSFWTVDTWTMEDVSAQLMDEGSTRRIFTKNDSLDVYMYYSGKMEFKKGNEDVLNNLEQSLYK